MNEQSSPPGEVRPVPAVTPEIPPLAPATRTGLGEAAAMEHSSCQAAFLQALSAEAVQGQSGRSLQ